MGADLPGDFYDAPAARTPVCTAQALWCCSHPQRQGLYIMKSPLSNWIRCVGVPRGRSTDMVYGNGNEGACKHAPYAAGMRGRDLCFTFSCQVTWHTL
jgi:hypothetical protein